MIGKVAAFLCACALGFAQEGTPAAAGAPDKPSGTIGFEDALARARLYGGQLQSATLTVKQSTEDMRQARAARLPSVNAFNQFIYTEGNGTPSGVFTANDGVHIYNEQAVIHQDLFALIRHGEIDRAAAAEAVARARVEVARRGLSATVISDFFAVVTAERKSENARAAFAETERFVGLTQKQEQGGEAAHADVIRAEIDREQRKRDADEAALNVLKAKITLGVLIFPAVTANYAVVDDLDSATSPESAAYGAAAASPDVQAASLSLEEAKFDVTVARYLWLPSFTLDFFYGIDANQFAAHTDYSTQATGRSTLPNYQVNGRQNLGYSAQATLNVPVWNWGATRSKVRQAEDKREQAALDLAAARKTFDGVIAADYAEAQAAERQLASLRGSVELAAESLRLTVLRYQAGDATALEVVDAQNTALLSRNAYDDGLARRRIAIANLHLLMGKL